jgi:AcrR family transcriptional regulator
MAGLRERKKQQTHDALSQAAIELFIEHGFYAVPVTDIAAVVEVSKPTLFKYFPSKEDLVMHRIEDHRGELARVVEESSAAPATAVRAHFLAGLTGHEPTTGLNDLPQVVAYYNLVFSTPALATRLREFIDDDERALAAALGGDLDAELLAAQLLSTRRILAYRNWQAISQGQSAADRYPTAVAEAEAAFGRLG